MQQHMIQELEKVIALAKGSKLNRFLHKPQRYLVAILFSKLWYRFSQKNMPVSTITFFGHRMEIELPASIDLYLLGGKTHDSELRLCKFLLRKLKSGDIFADVGAHFGFFSLLAAKIVGPHGHVFAFEPSINSFRLLKKNIETNTSITAIAKAVSDDHNGRTTFHEFPMRLSEFSSIFIEHLENEKWQSQAMRTTVDSVSIDGFFRELNLVPDIIKIDVEGAESLVIKGMQNLLKTGQPIIIMEYISNPQSTELYAGALTQLEMDGYRPFIIDEKGALSSIFNLSNFLKERGVDSENVVFCKY